MMDVWSSIGWHYKSQDLKINLILVFYPSFRPNSPYLEEENHFHTPSN